MYYVVTTTINKPTFIEKYIKDFKRHSHDYLFVIAGDLKTPDLVKSYCEEFDSVVYLDVEAQQREFSNLALTRFIPFNSIDRRNFAYLYCIKQGMGQDDVLITLDDDNLLQETDFLSRHAQSDYGGEVVVASRPCWYNAIEDFYEEPVFMRGFSPFDRKGNEDRKAMISHQKINVAMNQGLWEGNPDVDAIERIKGLKGGYKVKRKKKLVLGRNIVSPLDTQNTAYLNGFWLTAFLCPFVGRFDDIFSSYISKRIADHFGYGVSYGSPVVYQERNEHNNYEDFLLELQGMATVDTVVSFLWNIEMKGVTLMSAVQEIGKSLRRSFEILPLHTKSGDIRSCLWDVRQVGIGLELWLASLNELGVDDVAPRQEVGIEHSLRLKTKV
jgi:glycosyltransferase involved in cell wall biosynthesis